MEDAEDVDVLEHVGKQNDVVLVKEERLDAKENHAEKDDDK